MSRRSLAAFKNNPIAHRLSHQAHWPSLRLSFWLAFGLGLMTLAFSIWSLLHFSDSVFKWVLLGGWSMVLAGPLLIAPITALMTRRDLNGDQYQLLYLTPLSDETLAEGYILGALFRLRLLMALGVGFMPMVTVGTVYLGIRYEAAYEAMSGFYRPIPEEIIAPSPTETTWLAIVSIIFILLVLSFSFPSAAVGVALALRWKNPIFTTVVASFWSAFNLAIVAGGFNLVIALSFGNPYLLTFCQTIFLFICIYGLWVPMLANALKYVRRPIY
ncbi:MAG: hypothetical protein HY862_14990 [Chloroflexi bacterium]|nr:hypothetical protein [Chloroflexota bacterium]